MREDYYSDYYEFESGNWWFVSRRKILFALLQKVLPTDTSGWKILDAGCGTGVNLAWLAEFGDVTGVDNSPEAIRFCHLRNERNVQEASLLDLPYEDGSFDLVTALDVLEHIEDDEKALQEIARVCKPGGCLLVTVPVYPSLWGEHDEINEHKRRYLPKRLLIMIEANGFELVHRSFMNAVLLPAAFVWRWYRRIRRWFIKEKNHRARPDNMHHHPRINRLLIRLFTSELPFVIGRGLPIGLSLVVLARKK